MLDNDCKGYFTYGEYARSRLPVAIPLYTFADAILCGFSKEYLDRLGTSLSLKTTMTFPGQIQLVPPGPAQSVPFKVHSSQTHWTTQIGCRDNLDGPNDVPDVM